ncbi:MAG: prolyl oligopeptidase family serine peptidase [Acidobacteriota bacterium]
MKRSPILERCRFVCLLAVSAILLQADWSFAADDLVKLVSSEDARSGVGELDYYCPVRNITAEYSPILMVHETKDTDVPYQKSVDMAVRLKEKGVKQELVTVNDAGHGLAGGNPEDVAQAHSKAVAFIRDYAK